MNAPAHARRRPSRIRRRRRPTSSPGTLIRTLVGFDTTSRESNLALIDWVRDYLEVARRRSRTLTFDDDRRKANLFATLPARDGNATTGGIVLSGHTDVVPVDGQPWDTDPFEATLIGDRLVRARRHRHEELLGDRARVRARIPAPRPEAARCTSRCPTTRRSAASACGG